MNDLQNKIARLPMWAREYIKRLEAQTEPNNVELRLMRQKITNIEQRERKLRERVDAMTDLLTCAGRGGHETAQAYVDRIINEYTSEEDLS